MGITIICRTCSHEVEEGNPKCSDCACDEHDYDTYTSNEDGASIFDSGGGADG